MNRLTPSEYACSDKCPLVLVLDNVRSLHNVGSVFRTADALRAEHLFLCGITGVPPHAELHKTALGAEEVVAWSYSEETLKAIQSLKEKGYLIVALEQAEGSIELGDAEKIIKRGNKVALILGNEVQGVQQSVLEQCDHCLEIAQHGTKHSMNVSVAGGIAMWVISRLL